MDRISYSKPYLPINEQIELLRARGMTITEGGRAESCLHRIGYYRLSGYWFPFRYQEIITDLTNKKVRRVTENFRSGTLFSDVMDLYVFDKRLRLLFIDAIERIEVSLRVDIALILGNYGAFAHREANRFNTYFGKADAETKISPHEKFIQKLDEAFDRSREDFAISFKKKYNSAMPIWTAIELWDFGTLATVLSGMQAADMSFLAKRYNLPRNNLLVSWAQSINFVRNICAHHGRLWNRPPIQQPGPTKPGEVGLLDHLAIDFYAQRRLYAVAASLQYLLQIIHPESTWARRLEAHLATFPAKSGLSIRQMGFDKRWISNELWRLEDQKG